jgi:ubiquinol oxidase
MQACIDYDCHHVPKTISDHIALAVVKAMRSPADLFFARRYGHRAVVLETFSAVPGMVGGALQHLKSLRTMHNDRGKIKTLLDEAENERMHLMTFVKIAKPTWLERMIVLIVQGLMFNLYFLLYLITPKTCHRIVLPGRRGH